VADGRLARIQTRQGEAVALARVTDRQRRGSVFMPMHWTDAFAPSGRSNPLVAPNVDPRSGQPEFKHTPARVRPYRETWRGFLLARQARRAPDGFELIWRRVPQPACQLHEFAGRGDEVERAALRRALTRRAGIDVLRYEDAGSGAVREAYFTDGRLDRVLFLTASGALPPRDWLAELFTLDRLGPAERGALLIGRAPGRAVETGPVVCACRGVRAARIEAAIEGGAEDIDAVGEATGAGTSCGSCRPEIARMLPGAPRGDVRRAA
jgi:assimilatory nitrate reductase catalytic subunit